MTDKQLSRMTAKDFSQICERFGMNATITTKAPAPDQTIKADAGKPQLSLVPPQIMHDIAVIREYGNRKYSDPDSWRRVDPQRYIDALLRHALTLGANPLGTDEESGLPHLWHLECNAAFLSEMYRDEFRRRLDSEWRKEN